MNYEKYNGNFAFFYGGPFSQWASCAFTVDSVEYNCAEQYMMATKARLFGDWLALEAIMATTNPSAQKAVGRRVKGFKREVWDMVSRDVVRTATLAKFTSTVELYEYLLNTEGEYLVEASPTDTIWGIGMGEHEEGLMDPANWKGTNWLGEVLVEVREWLILARDAHEML